jgi:phage baseplate assembly protein W
VAIKLSNLQQLARQYGNDLPFVYQDLHLDFEVDSRYDTTLGYKIQRNDIGVDYDEDAINNSLRNLLTTKPGQRFLFPLYGLDLTQFLFEPITSFNAQLIGDLIVYCIDNFESRVSLLNVGVVPDTDNNIYNITIIVEIPIFNTTTTINSILDTKTQSFVFLNTPTTQ